MAWQLIKVFLSPSVRRKTKVYLFVGILLCILVITVVIGLNIGGVGDWFESLVVVQRFRNEGVSNRFIAMPLWRTRSIGMQFYKFNIVGFLHWGYNFYNASLSKGTINPYLDTCANYSFPAGDAFSVYPAQDGSALESIRILSFYDALQDARAFRLAETLCGRERVIEELESIFGEEIRFDRCAKEAATLLQIREKINEMIQKTHNV
jgi:hypothetical protein